MAKKTNLTPVPRLGLIHDISARLYYSFESQLREAISNGLDAGATECSIDSNLNGSPRSVTIKDNGIGLSEEELQKELLSVGGSSKLNQYDSIGHIGIGFYALTSSCKSLEIITKKKGTRKVVKAEVNCSYIHDVNNKRIEMSQANIGKWVKTEEKDLPNEECFTFLKMIEPDNNIQEMFSDANKYLQLKRNLQRILPIEYDENSKIFEKRPELLRLLKSLKLKALKVRINSEGLKRLLYGDEDKQDLNGRIDIIDIERNGIRYCGHVYLGTKKIEPEDWHGYTLRVNNVAIGGPTFLDYIGKGIKPRGIRITADIHLIKFSKEAILIGRESFHKKHEDYQNLENFIFSELKKNIDFINEDYGTLKQANSILRAPEKFCRSIEKASVIEIPLFSEPPKHKKPLSLSSEPNITETDVKKELSLPVKYTKKTDDSKENYVIQYRGRKKAKPELVVKSELPFSKPLKLKIQDNDYEVMFKKKGNMGTPIEIDYVNKIIYFNKAAKIFENQSFLDAKLLSALFWLRHAYDHSKDVDEFYSKALSILPKLLK